MTTTFTSPVFYGRYYEEELFIADLADLAHGMPSEIREELHNTLDIDTTDQQWWDAYVAKVGEDAADALWDTVFSIDASDPNAEDYLVEDYFV